MKKTLSFILSLIMVIGVITSVPVTASAASIGDLTFTYDYYDDSYSVTDCKYTASGKVIVPAEYNGLSVTSIDNAFSDCEKITEVVLPDTITYISEYAFVNCTNLESIDVDEDNYYFSSIDGVLYNWDATVLMKYPGNKKSTDYNVPGGVEEIYSYAFNSCSNLVSISIPESVLFFPAPNFFGCVNLEEINVDNDNQIIASIDGVLFDKDISELYKYPRNKPNVEYTVPKGVEGISGAAFSGCKNLETVTISDGVIYMLNAFSDCSNLKKINIPRSMSTIGFSCFDGCESLRDVYYPGSVAQWLEIFIDDRNDCLTNANIHFGVIDNAPSTPKIKSASRTARGVKVSWNRVLGADDYIVYRKTAKSGWTRLGTTTENTFTDTKAKTGTTCYYTVKAQNEAGASGYNKTGLKIKFVAAPKLTSIANESSGVRVKWSKVSGADGYYLYRRVAGSKSWTKIATIKKGSTTSYLDKKASAGKTYEYIIKCYDGSTPSAAAAKVIKIKRLTVPKLVSAKSAKAGVTVKWGKVAGAEGYLVYRKTGKASWSQVGKVEGNSTFSYIDASAKKGKTYAYTVRAYSSSYKSAYNTKGLSVKDKY